MSGGRHGASRIATNGAGTAHEAAYQRVWDETVMSYPLYTVTLVIAGRLTERNFAGVAAGFLSHFCELGWHLGQWPRQ